MPKLTTRNLGIYLSQASKPAPADIITNVTNAAPAVVTPTTIGNYADGDIVLITGTGFASLDDKYWPISGVTGTTFELDCSDASGEAAPATEGVARVYKMTGQNANLVQWCLTSYSYDQPQAETIDQSTFCGTASASGQPQPATYTTAGILDGCEEGFGEMLKALEDGKDRLMVFKLPSEPPSWVFQTVDIGSYSESYELNASITFTSGGAIKSGPFRVYCKSCVDYLPINAAIAGTGTASATITFTGGPSDAEYTVTLTASTAAGAITGLTPVSVAQGATIAQVATAVAAELDGKQDAGTTDTLVASAVDGVVTVTESGGGNIVTLTAVIA